VEEKEKTKNKLVKEYEIRLFAVAGNGSPPPPLSTNILKIATLFPLLQSFFSSRDCKKFVFCAYSQSLSSTILIPDTNIRK
jgi:hypothetical protein